jgi:hypothetical protein
MAMSKRRNIGDRRPARRRCRELELGMDIAAQKANYPASSNAL